MTAVVEHLEKQVASSRRLLGIVLAQGDAIRAQDVEGVLARVADIHAELLTRSRLELERSGLIADAAGRFAVDEDDVGIEHVLAGVSFADADRARALSAELQGLLRETERTHRQNQVLVRQELTFLSHLMSILSGAPQGGYLPSGWAPSAQPAHTVDARA